MPLISKLDIKEKWPQSGQTDREVTAVRNDSSGDSWIAIKRKIQGLEAGAPKDITVLW